MTFFKFMLALNITILLGIEYSNAQEFNDKELETFTKVMNAYLTKYVAMTETIGEQAEKLNLSLERYEELSNASRKKQLQASVTDDQELKAFYELQALMIRVQSDLDAHFHDLVEQSGLTMNQFEEINDAYYTHQEVRARIDALMWE